MSHDVWSIVTLLGLTGWVGAMILLLLTAFPGRGRFEAGPARLWGGVLVLSYAVWVAGMLNA